MKFHVPYLALAVPFATALSLQAQTEARPKVQFIADHDQGKSGKSMVTSQYLVTADLREKEDKAAIHFNVYDRSTSSWTGSSDWSFEMKFRSVMTWAVVDDKPCLIYEQWDDSKKVMDVQGQWFHLPAMDPDGGPFRIGHLELKKSVTPPIMRFAHKFVLSPDRKKACVYFDDLQDNEHEQLVLTSVFSGDGPLWSNVAHIAHESDDIDNAGLAVSDDGTVYFMMKAYFKTRAVVNNKVRYTFEVFRAKDAELIQQPVELPTGLTAASATLTRSSDGVRVGGFYVEQGASKEKTAGYFVSDKGADLLAKGPAQTHRITAQLPGELEFPKMFQGGNGLYYLTAACSDLGTTVDEKGIFAAAVDEQGAEVWQRMILRNRSSSRKASAEPPNTGYFANIDHGDLVIGFPDAKENLEAFNTGKEPERTKGEDATVSIVVRMGKNGPAQWDYFKGERDYYMFNDRYNPVAPDLFLKSGEQDQAKGRMFVQLK